jgi:SulP family sulfate permease
MSRSQQLLPFLNWPRPTLALLRSDVLAGLSVGLMVIPQGVAYAALAGMPLVTGIYASLLPALLGVLFSASVRLSVGPTALTCLLVASSLTGLAEPGSAQWVELAVWLALLSGLLQLGLGFIRFGWLLNLVSAPVLMAFTQAAALLIVASQLPSMFGLTSKTVALPSLQSAHLPSLAFGLASFVLLQLARRWRPTFPSVLVLVLLASGVSAWLVFTGQVVGQLPQGLPVLYVPTLPSGAMLAQLVLPTLVIGMVSFLETAASAKADNEALGKRWNQDQDLIGQGLAKIASALCGSFPTSASFSRSALYLYTGARSGWASVVSVIVVWLTLLFFLPVLSHVPRAVLAAIVVVPVLGLIKPQAFFKLWRISPVEAAIAGATFIITLLTAPQLYWGVLSGVLMALSHYLYQSLHPRIIEVGLHPDGSLRDRHLLHLPPLAPQVFALRMDAALDFATASSFERAVNEHLTQHPDTQHVCLFAQPINRIDATGVEMFTKLVVQLQQLNISLHISGMKLPAAIALRSAGALHEGPKLKTYRTDAEALASMAQLRVLPNDLAGAAI